MSLARYNGSYWTVFSNTRTTLNGVSGQKLMVDSPEMYYIELSNDYHKDSNHSLGAYDKTHVILDGQVKEMKRAVPTLTEGQEYEITFC